MVIYVYIDENKLYIDPFKRKFELPLEYFGEIWAQNRKRGPQRIKNGLQIKPIYTFLVKWMFKSR